MTVWIGTSGWQYRHWRGRFYPAGLPQKAWLEHYAERFDPGDDLYVYLNNDTAGCAPRDARLLAGRLARAGLRPTRVPGPRETPVVMPAEAAV